MKLKQLYETAGQQVQALWRQLGASPEEPALLMALADDLDDMGFSKQAAFVRHAIGYAEDMTDRSRRHYEFWWENNEAARQEVLVAHREYEGMFKDAVDDLASRGTIISRDFKYRYADGRQATVAAMRDIGSGAPRVHVVDNAVIEYQGQRFSFSDHGKRLIYLKSARGAAVAKQPPLPVLVAYVTLMAHHYSDDHYTRFWSTVKQDIRRKRLV